MSESKGLRPAVKLPDTGGKPAPGSHLTEQTLRALGRPLPVVPPPEEPEADFGFSDDA